MGRTEFREQRSYFRLPCFPQFFYKLSTIQIFAVLQKATKCNTYSSFMHLKVKPFYNLVTFISNLQGHIFFGLWSLPLGVHFRACRGPRGHRCYSHQSPSRHHKRSAVIIFITSIRLLAKFHIISAFLAFSYSHR